MTTMLPDIKREFSYADQTAYPEGAYLAVFLDAYNLAKVKEPQLQRPFDTRFAGWMKELLSYFMQSSRYAVLLGYTISDELFLVLSPDFNAWGRRPSHFLSILSSEAAVQFETRAHFALPWEAKVLPCSTLEEVAEFTCTRRALAIWSLVKNQTYYLLRAEGQNSQGADQTVRELSHTARLDYIAQALGHSSALANARSQRPPELPPSVLSQAEYEAALGVERLGLFAYYTHPSKILLLTPHLPFDYSLRPYCR